MSTKITVYKGIDNIFDLIIKKNKSTLPLELTDSDIFKIHLIELATNTSVLTLTQAVSDVSKVTITDKLNGKITVVFKASDIQNLKSIRGSSADDFYNKATYRLLIEAVTVNQGRFVATLNKVAVG